MRKPKSTKFIIDEGFGVYMDAADISEKDLIYYHRWFSKALKWKRTKRKPQAGK